MSDRRVFANIPARECIREGWKEYAEFRAIAQRARETTWGLQEPGRRLVGVLVMLEEAEALIAHQKEQIAALETVNEELTKRTKGLEMTIGRMKKRDEKRSGTRREPMDMASALTDPDLGPGDGDSGD